MTDLEPRVGWKSAPARRWAFDVVLAVVATAVALPQVLRTPHPDFLQYVAVALQLCPLVFRRVWPVPVFLWVCLFAGLAAFGGAQLIACPAPLIALYTVVISLPRRRALQAVAVLEVGVIAGSVALAGARWWYDAFFLSGLVVAVLGLGLYAATRQEFLAELRDRAERVERERDQQVALAAADERSRIARELHDIVAHHLTVMVALSEGAIAVAPTSHARSIEVMRAVSSTGRQALSDTRRLLGVLRDARNLDGDADASPPDLSPQPDLGEVGALVDRVRAAGLPTTLDVTGGTSHLPPGVQLAAYRLVQEALTNTLKHAGTQAHASVRVRALPEELLVDVEDDGDGLGVSTAAGAGSGLLGMRERIEAYGGEMRSNPVLPRGWKVSARLRLDAVGSS